jgi:hypothetical protein
MSIQDTLRFVAKNHGKSRLSQVLEIVRLSLGHGRLTAKEYYDFRLFDDALYSFEEKQQFLGHAGQEHVKKFLINDRWRILADDKFIFDTLFRSQGFPLAKILATYRYQPNKRACTIPSLNTADELISFLDSDAEYPFFGKPINENFGLGCVGVTALDRAEGRLTLADGQTIAIDQYIEDLQKYANGYMFQERMRPHPVVLEAFGDRVATVRVVVLVRSRGAQILRACCYVPAGNNMTNHYFYGRTGNLLAAIDRESGRIERVILSPGADEQYIEHHPDTGMKIQGLTLPCWHELREICMEAAMILPGFRLQSWDIALCEQGPVLQEVQDGDYRSPQMTSRQGLLDDQLRQYIGSINKYWRREIALSTLDQMPRRIYRRLYPAR